VRLEKTFTVAKKYTLGIIFDVLNVFNDDTIIDWGTRVGYDWFLPGTPDYPDYDDAAGHDLYSLPMPRQARLGIRLMF